MAQLDHKRFCPNCQDHSEGLISLTCGHSYCMSCNQSWDLGSQLDQSRIPNSPQCKPKLVLKNAGPGDVACDECSDRKLKASRSCLQCLASNCELHHRPHYESQIFHNHQLVEASAELQEIICSVHRQAKEDEHQGHNTVLAAEQRTKMQKELGPMRYEIQQKIQDTKREMQLLQKHLEANNSYANEALNDCQTRFNRVIELVNKRSCEVQKQITSQLQTKATQTNELQKKLQKKLQQEISELRRIDTELQQLSQIKEDSQFLLRYSVLSEPTHSADTLHHPSCFQEVRAAVLELTEKLQSILSQDYTLPSVTEKMVEEATLHPPASFMRSSPETGGNLHHPRFSKVGSGRKKSKLLQPAESRVKGRIQSSTSWFRPAVKICPVVSGRTFGAAEAILVQVKNQKSTTVQTGSLQDCDIIMVFCPITSRIGSDVEGALGREEVSSSDKPIILVLMHHTREVEYSSGRRNWAENNPKVKLQVHILFHQTQQGLLQCDRNNQAVIEIQKELHKHSYWSIWPLTGFNK